MFRTREIMTYALRVLMRGNRLNWFWGETPEACCCCWLKRTFRGFLFFYQGLKWYLKVSICNLLFIFNTSFHNLFTGIIFGHLV